MELDGFRLPTGLWVTAVLRQLPARGQAGYVIQQGDDQRGTLLVRLSGRDGSCRLELQQRDLDGRLGWVPALSEAEPGPDRVDEYVARSRLRDPDLWVIEIEVPDAASTNPFADASMMP